MRILWVPVLVSISLLAAGKPEDEFAGVVKTFLGKSFVNDWTGLEKLGRLTWAPLPPNMLQNCLPDGGCFSRQGAALFGDRKLMVVATGARTMTSNLYLRNPGAPLGESAVLTALKEAGLSASLARCPMSGGPGGTNWYKLSGAAVNPGVLSVQSSCNGKPCEGFVLSAGAELPPLQPNQLKMYSEQCSGAESERRPVSTALPHEQLAQLLAAVISGPTDWKGFAAAHSAVQWNPAPRQGPPSLSGNLALSGRQFSVLATGTPAQVRNVTFEEGGLHPRGEHLLGVMYAPLGFQVKLVRCGPIYTESTNNWYSLTSAKTQPVMLRQSIRYDGQRVQDSYELRLDATTPGRDPRDRDPGVNGCR